MINGESNKGVLVLPVGCKPTPFTGKRFESILSPPNVKLCHYGCNKIGKFILKNKKLCCSKSPNSCEVIRNKNRRQVLKSYKRLNRKPYVRKSTKAVWNKGLSKETDLRIKTLSDKKKGKNFNPTGFKHSEETKKKIAIAMLGNQKGKHRGKKCIYNNITFKSSWEEKVAKYLDNLNINWKYEQQCFLLNERQTYRPDFFIYNKNNNLIKLIEVKGYWRNQNKIKFDLFLKKYPELTIEIWDKDKLKSLKIL